VLTPCLSQIPLKLRFEALKHWLDAWAFVTTDPMGQWPLAKFDELIAANKRDFDARYAKARVLLASDDWTGAMDELLEIIMRDKKMERRSSTQNHGGFIGVAHTRRTQRRCRSHWQICGRH
jgi:putative thioredoxin